MSVDANDGISIKVSRVTLEKLKEFRKKHGYKSYDKAILALVERSLAQDEMLEKLETVLRSVIKSEFDDIERSLVKQMKYTLEFLLEKDKDLPTQ